MLKPENNIESPRPKRVWYQYSFLSLLLFTTLSAFAFSAWAWWNSTREQRALERAVQECDFINDEVKELLCDWIWQEGSQELLKAHRIETLVSQGSHGTVHYLALAVSNRLHWDSTFSDSDGGERRVLVFSGTIVVTDIRNRVLCWKEMGRFFANAALLGHKFDSASLTEREDGEVELAVTLLDPDEGGALTTHCFLISDDAITEIGDGDDE
jgi:hypothetical protein